MEKVPKIGTVLLSVLLSSVTLISGCSSSSSLSKKDRIAGREFLSCYESKINQVRILGSAKNVDFKECLDSRMSSSSREMNLVIASINNFAFAEKQAHLAENASVVSLYQPDPGLAKNFRFKNNSTRKLAQHSRDKRIRLSSDSVVLNRNSNSNILRTGSKVARQSSRSIPLPSLENILNKKKGMKNNRILSRNIKNTSSVRKVAYRKVIAKNRAAGNSRRIIHKVAMNKPKIRNVSHDKRENLSSLQWKQIVTGFALKPHLNKKLVKEYVAYYSKNSEAVTKLTQRAAVFLPMIMEEIRNRGMPMEIALLPFVESGFSTKAVSDKKAVGLWQFISETGKRYGLKNNSHYDARLNPDAATTAALDYLQDLHQQFDGDWLLALAAYNAGEARVTKAVSKQMKAGKPVDFWSLSSLPKETRMYVPRLLAYRELIRRPDAYNIKLPSDNEFIELKRLRVAHPVDLQHIAEKAKLPRNDILCRLNPNFISGKTQPKYERNVLVPSIYFNKVRMAIHRTTKL